MYLNLVLKKFIVYNEVKYYDFHNILNMQIDFKHNDIYKKLNLTTIYNSLENIIYVYTYIHLVYYL